ncbi:centrosomal protein [Caerostris extrusa]|uniref:Centrosomal protein n=1 Tax=Caerostris extrusa TaxID=172846 RepID=A0AAV4Q0R2_CAEEX|nr:centrosomal protein [Caerostris extrusa]
MYVDVEVAQLIRALDRKKHKAIFNDRFVYAKKLKYAQNQLMKVGEKLGKLDIEKELAKIIKENDEENQQDTFIQNGTSKHKRSSISSRPPNEMLVPMVGNFLDHDENVVPALNKGVKKQPSVFPGSDVETGNDLVLGKLTEKRGERRRRCLLMCLSHSPNDVVKAASFLLQKALCDKVFSIYTSALSILAMCFKSFIPTHQVSKIEAATLAEKNVNGYFREAPRLKNASVQYLTNEFPYSELENFQIISLYVLDPLQHVLNVRLAQGRCELLEKLIEVYPPSSHTILSLSKVMPFLVDALQHPASSVRGAAERIILCLYEREGPKVRKHIPFESSASKRNIMHRRLLQAFDKIDKQSSVKGKSNNKKKEFQNKFLLLPLLN